MKKTFLLLLFALGISVWGRGQTTLFTETMGGGGSNGASIATWESNNYFDNDDLTMSGTGDMRNTSTSSGYTGASGTWNVMLNATNEFFQIAGINSQNYTDLTLSFGIRKGTTAENGSTMTVAVSSNGTSWTNLTMPSLPTGTGTATWYYRTCTGSIPSTSTLYIKFTSTSTTEFRIDDISLTGTASSPTPTLSVSPDVLSGFTYAEGAGPSAEQTFTVSGSNLRDDISILTSTNYEISETSGSGFTSTITLDQSGGIVEGTTIYVRLKAGLSAGSYNSEEITASSTGADNKTVSCSGSVSPPPDPEPTNHATDFTATTNSHNQITLTWTDATGTQLPHAYLVKAAVAPATPTAPTDGVAEGDGTLVKNIDFGDEEAIFTGLEPGTTYNFAIWPYTNGGSSIDYKIGGQPTAVAQTEEQPYIVDFEGTGETKTAYTSGTVTLSGIDWDMTEALIGIDAADWKNGARSARLRGYGTSSMTMLENKPDGIGTISFSYRRYGSDTQVDWKVEYSIDKGLNWTQVGSAFTAPASDVVQTFSETVNVPGNVRIRIKRATETGASNQRLNIDDIAITDYEVATFTGTGAWTETARWSTGQVPGSSDEVLIHGSCSVAGAVTIGNVYIGSDYSLEIETTGALTINTKLVNNEVLFIYSDASGTGSLIVNGTVSGSGKAYIERYLTKYDSQNDNKYHFISAPVTAQAIRPEFVANTPAEDEDFYYFDEEQNLWINSKTETNEWNAGFENNFIVGKGYMASYPANGSKLFEGTLNNDASYVLTCTHTTDQGKGWNLLGNPYQAAIDWDAVTLGDGMDNALYYYDSQNEKYRYYISYPGINNENYLGSGSRYIPPMQGFMVHAQSTGTKTVTIEKADLAHEAQTTFYKSGYNLVPGSMALTLISGERRDEAFVHFTSGATEAFDGQYDAYKLLSGNAVIPEIYTTNSGNVKFAINGLPELSGQTEVPVSIKANQPGVYSISADLSNLPATAYLNDIKTGTVHNLSQNPVYTFTAAEGDAPNRFKLTFGSVGIDTPAGKPIAAYYAAGRLHFVNAQAEKTIEVFNMAGQRFIFAKTTANEYPVNLSAGMYVVKVSTAQQLVSAKFFVK